MTGSAPARELQRPGYFIRDEFLSPEECQAVLAQIEGYRRNHTLPEIYRPMKPRALRYQVIDGERIRENLPAIWELYLGRVQRAVDPGPTPAFVPLSNIRAGVNVNIMQPGRSSYRWHYDRTRVSCILYLNRVEGGETELYPNFRIPLGKAAPPRAQQALDSLIQSPPIRRLFGRKVVTRPEVGRLLVMRADRCWHSVRPVAGQHDRINIVLAYDRPGAEFRTDAALDAYLYTQQPAASADPNY